MKKLTEKEIHRKFAEAFFECVYMDLSKEASYYREGMEKYLETLTTEDINKLLLEVNINYDNYIISEANKYYPAIVAVVENNLGKVLPKFKMKDKDLSIMFVPRPDQKDIQFKNKGIFAQYDPLFNCILLYITNKDNTIDQTSINYIKSNIFKDAFTHELTHFEDYDNIINSYPNAIENSKLIQPKNPDDGLLEINALTVQLIQALDKQLIDDFRQNMLNSDEKINKENLPNMIRKALDRVLNNKTTVGRNTLIASKINNLSEENKRKVIKHVYLYFMDEFIQTYPFLKQNS